MGCLFNMNVRKLEIAAERLKCIKLEKKRCRNHHPPKRWLSKRERELILELLTLLAYRMRYIHLIKHGAGEKQLKYWRREIDGVHYEHKNKLREAYAPHFIAKYLRCDVSIVYNVLRQFAKTGDVLFSGDLGRKDRKMKRASLQKVDNDSKAGSMTNALSTGHMTAVVADGEIKSPTSVNADPYYRTSVGEDILPLYYKYSDLHCKKQQVLRTSIDIAASIFLQRFGYLPAEIRRHNARIVQ